MDLQNIYGVPGGFDKDELTRSKLRFGNNSDDEDDLFDRSSEKDEEEEDEESSSASSTDNDDEEDEDKYVPFSGDVSNYVEMIRVEPEKVMSERPGRDKRAISDICTSKYKLGPIIARGRQAVIFKGCATSDSRGTSTESCPYIIRLALLRDQGESAPKYQKNHESFAGFQRDVDVRRYLEDECSEGVPFLKLVDAFICNKQFGVAVGPRLSGNLMNLLHRSNDPMGLLPEIEIQVRAAINGMHSCGVAHRDISYQNILYSGDEQKFQVFLTDFEDAYIQVVTPIQAFENPERIFDAYKISDMGSVETTIEELTEMARLFQAVKRRNLDAAKRAWNAIGSFVKSDLEHSYPEIRQFIHK